jgi:two-component system phosphate regulon sensor histidine kinase PhoR
MIVAVSAVLGQFGPWLLLAAAAGVALCGLLLVGREPGGRLLAPAERGEMPRPAIAAALLATVPDPVILVDRHANVIESNEAARDLLPGLMLQSPLSFALRSPDVLDGIGRVLETGEPLRVEYFEQVPTERTFEVQIGPLKHGQSHADAGAGVVLFFRDLTSARRLERMRVDFVANASHELRTPLASLLGFIETLQGPAREDPAARARFLEIMRGQALRMTRLIDDLLSLSRIEMRAHLAPDVPVDIVPITRQIIDALTPMARDSKVEIVWSGPPGPVYVLGDRDEIQRVAENLVENAVKYGESGGRVDVGLAVAERPGRASGHVVLTVRDYGPGIAPEHLPRLTERFYRADVAQSREKGGTGLGLAIVKHIVNRHKGQLAIESEPGKGALFTVTLPEHRA